MPPPCQKFRARQGGGALGADQAGAVAGANFRESGRAVESAKSVGWEVGRAVDCSPPVTCWLMTVVVCPLPGSLRGDQVSATVADGCDHSRSHCAPSPRVPMRASTVASPPVGPLLRVAARPPPRAAQGRGVNITARCGGAGGAELLQELPQFGFDLRERYERGFVAPKPAEHEQHEQWLVWRSLSALLADANTRKGF